MKNIKHTLDIKYKSYTPLDLSDQFELPPVFVVQDNVSERLKESFVGPFVQYFEEGRPESNNHR